MKPSKAMRNIGQRDAAPVEMGYRELQVRASSLNLEDRSIMADVSTENPVPMPDFVRMEMVPEILVTSGAVLPESRQVPFLDSHQRASVANQLGSARDIGTKYNKLTARLQFSSAADGEFTKVREGHVTDVSAGYQILKKQYVPAGETKTISGRNYQGPANVVTKWRLLEVSLTPIGADSQAKLRGLDPSLCRFLSPSLEFTMKPEVRAWLVSRGMDNALDDDAAQQWMLENRSKLVDQPKPEEKPAERKAAEVPQIDMAAINAAVAKATVEAMAAERARIAAFHDEVRALAGLAGLPDTVEHCQTLVDVAAVRKFLADEKAKRAEAIGYQPNIRQIGSGAERLMRDMGTALNLRSLQSVCRDAKTIDSILPAESRGAGHATFRHATPYQMAEECVRAMGVDTRGLTREQVAICAMFGPDVAGLRSAVPAYHTTGSFSNLTLDAMNKTLLAGYTEAPSTWRGPMRQATSVPDFKQIHRIRLGAVPNLPVWNDNSEPEQAALADAKESYAVESRSLNISYSYKLLVNDDMDALSRTPAMMGAAAARTVNAVAWAIVTANANLSDGQALFLETPAGNRKRKNLTTGAGAPSVSTLQTLSNLMRLMRGENTLEGAESGDILNLSPRYLIGPSALDTTIKQLVLSAYDPAATNHLTYNTATQLIPVIEPLLDVASTTAWYVFADPSQIDTVEVSFLQGQESPVTRSFMDERTLAQNVTILQTFAAKAINHRGVQKHAGA